MYLIHNTPIFLNNLSFYVIKDIYPIVYNSLAKQQQWMQKTK